MKENAVEVLLNLRNMFECDKEQLIIVILLLGNCET